MTATAQHIQVRATATGPLELHRHTGAALRGAFFGALWGRFCVNQAAPSCAACPLVAGCPVSTLVAPLRNEAPRGRDVPRPYALRPPVNHAGSFGPGDQFAWGLTLFGSAATLFPYVAMTLHTMGQAGVGKRVAENEWERGRFCIDGVQALNPLSGATQTIQASGAQQIAVPSLSITWADAVRAAERLPDDHVTLEFVTPLRLIDQQHCVRQPLLRPLVQRLLERHDALASEYGGTPFAPTEREQLTAAAAAATLLDDHTRWVDLDSYSRRQRRRTPIGGLLGHARYGGELRPLLPLLVWGTVAQVGKDTTKGNGVYRIVAPDVA